MKKLITNRFNLCQFTLPQLSSANEFYCQKNFNQAYEYYDRVEKIFQSANMVGSPQYQLVAKKLISCLFLTKKYTQVIERSNNIIENKNLSNNFFHFSSYSSSLMLKEKPQQKGEKQVLQLVKYLLCDDVSQVSLKEAKGKFPVLSNIASVLNCRSNYKELLLDLVEREKSKEAQQAKITSKNNPLQLLEAMIIVLSCKNLKTQHKKQVNQEVNIILKEYELNSSENVYQPLLVIVMNLIVQKNFMSSEGMLGYIKGEKKLFSDDILTNNLYRMLIARANNEEYEKEWEKEEHLNLGYLVTERVISDLIDIV